MLLSFSSEPIFFLFLFESWRKKLMQGEGTRKTGSSSRWQIDVDLIRVGVSKWPARMHAHTQGHTMPFFGLLDQKQRVTLSYDN